MIKFFDGGMGSMLNLAAGELPEKLNISDPERVFAVHDAYAKAGAQFITANTFGANSLKYDNVDELVKAGVALAKKAGKKVLVIDKNPVIGGHIYTERKDGIDIHVYGAHIFHTDDERVWKFVNSFDEFNRFTNSPLANYKGKLYHLPFNMNTFYELFGTITPDEAKKRIEEEAAKEGISEDVSAETHALLKVGRTVYETLVKGYTEKQWGRSAAELPPYIVGRLPIRLTYDNNYFNDKYQGIPVDGYTSLISNMLDGIEVRLNSDFLKDRNSWINLADKVLDTGPIDA